MRRLAAVVLGLIVAASTGCSATLGNAPPPAAPAAQIPPGVSQADVIFSQSLIPHEWLSIKVAEVIEKRSTNPFLKQLAAEMKTEKAAEIERMSGWLRSWGLPVPDERSPTPHTMPGMITGADRANLKVATPEEFDQKALTMLAGHFGSAVQMAKDLLPGATHAETKALAQQVITEQQDDLAKVNNELS
jgi:uncharacterized protein (DUF305 family)